MTCSQASKPLPPGDEDGAFIDSIAACRRYIAADMNVPPPGRNPQRRLDLVLRNVALSDRRVMHGPRRIALQQHQKAWPRPPACGEIQTPFILKSVIAPAIGRLGLDKGMLANAASEQRAQLRAMTAIAQRPVCDILAGAGKDRGHLQGGDRHIALP